MISSALLHLEKKNHHIVVYNHLMKETQMDILTGVCNGKARGNGHKLKYGKFWLDLREKTLWQCSNTETYCPERSQDFLSGRLLKLSWELP